MGLENITDFIADLLYSSDKTLDLVGVMGIIVYNQIPAVIAMDIKPSFNARKFREYGSYRLQAYSEFRKQRDACKAVVEIVLPWQREFELLAVDLENQF